ncbi:iron-regulated outer membrane protein, partial [Helicobacter pylori]
PLTLKTLAQTIGL